MSKTVHENLIDLQYKLKHTSPDNPDSKEKLQALADKINHQLQLEKLGQRPDTDFVEELGLTITEFEQDHPTLSSALKSILLTLQNIGI